MKGCFQDNLGSRWLEIEKLVRDLQIDIYKNREILWDGNPPKDEVQLLEPGVGLELLGYAAESVDFLGTFSFEGRSVEVAGLIESAERHVLISRRFSKTSQLFTAAHELGHAVLHPEVATLHRDRSLGGTDVQRDWREREADWYATCFLMPAKVVRERFIRAFGTNHFVLTDDSAFALSTTSMSNFLGMMRGQRDLAYRLATANRFCGREIPPLNVMFGVSPTAMAIRLEQLGLVAPIRREGRAPAFLSA